MVRPHEVEVSSVFFDFLERTGIDGWQVLQKTACIETIFFAKLARGTPFFAPLARHFRATGTPKMVACAQFILCKLKIDPYLGVPARHWRATCARTACRAPVIARGGAQNRICF